MDELISEIVKRLFDVELHVETEVPDEQFGDVSANIAMQLAGRLQKNPKEIAELIAQELQNHEEVEKVDIAGPGFINVTYTDAQLIKNIYRAPQNLYEGKKYLIEYSCPNYFKELHAGHLYQTLEGDVIARLVEQAGAEVYRANFGGDVGLHVAKCVWGMVLNVSNEPNTTEETFVELLQHMSSIQEGEHTQFIAQSYVKGSLAYDSSEQNKEIIDDLNKKLYQSVQNEDSSTLKQIHELGRSWSKDYFTDLYAQLGVTPFDQYYPESSTEGRGIELVEQHRDGIFTLSDGATVFEGEEYGLHTRVFITSKGLPTYETKDLGLIDIQRQDFEFDHRVLITGRDQQEYMKVVWKVVDLISPGLANKMTHLVNGIIKFGDGQKMSSRLGNVTTAHDVLDAVRRSVEESGDEERDKKIYLGAVKYQFLKHRLGGDMAFDPKESVATDGNSGPYLQYAHARAKSILRKAQAAPESELLMYNHKLGGSERTLVRKLGEYTSVIELASKELAPHVICTYLYELAQSFNRFYEENKVIGSAQEIPRITLVGYYADTLKKGLNLLGIHAPEQM